MNPTARVPRDNYLKDRQISLQEQFVLVHDSLLESWNRVQLDLHSWLWAFPPRITLSPAPSLPPLIPCRSSNGALHSLAIILACLPSLASRPRYSPPSAALKRTQKKVVRRTQLEPVLLSTHKHPSPETVKSNHGNAGETLPRRTHSRVHFRSVQSAVS